MLTGGVCAKDGQLQAGDRLVSVNDESLEGVAHSVALQALKKPAGTVTFVILREIEEKDNINKNTKTKTTHPQQEKQPASRRNARNIIAKQERRPQPPVSPPLEVSENHPLLPPSDSPPPPPSFSPPPPPVLFDDEPVDEEDSLSSPLPVVPPPPSMSPTLKRFLTQEKETSGLVAVAPVPHVQEVRRKKTGTSRAAYEDKRTVLSRRQEPIDSDALSTEGSDDVFMSSHGSLAAEDQILEVVDSSDSSQNFSTPPPLLSIGLQGKGTANVAVPVPVRPVTVVTEPATPPVSQYSTSPPEETRRPVMDLASPPSEKNSFSAPVMGKRAEDRPFVIELQKKFRNLGVKVALDDQGNTIVAELSSFGLIAKEGNVR